MTDEKVPRIGAKYLLRPEPVMTEISVLSSAQSSFGSSSCSCHESLIDPAIVLAYYITGETNRFSIAFGFSVRQATTNISTFDQR